MGRAGKPTCESLEVIEFPSTEGCSILLDLLVAIRNISFDNYEDSGLVNELR